jgi:hypothetical protein
MASDPYADLLNTQGMYGMFNPNPYLEFQGQIPMAGYAGYPTDASGAPIQKPPGMSLNSSASAAPAAAPPAQDNSQMNQLLGTLINNARGAPQQSWGSMGQFSGSGQGTLVGDLTAQRNALQAQPQAAPAAAPAAPAQSAAGLTRDQYLQLLANPGQVPMPGAQAVPGATPTGAPPPNVLQQFLANNQGKTGAGGYSNQGFFNTLKSLQGA